MITDHVWRTYPNRAESAACAYMNCRRPRSAHEFAYERQVKTRVRAR